MTPRERDELIDALLDRVISEADFLRLEAELHTSRAARDAYYARLRLHTILAAETEAEAAMISEANIDASPFAPKGIRHVHPGWLVLAALLPIVLGSVFWFALGKQNASEPGDPSGVAATEQNEVMAHGFATLFDQTDAVWSTPSGDNKNETTTLNLQRGDLLPAGVIQLKSGEAQIEFFSGALVSLEAGAAFEVISAMELDMQHGTLRAHVPEPARGFLVRTPSGQLVDLGTEFTLDVSEQHSDLQVIEGEVEWHPRSSTTERNQPKVNLTEGKSLHWERDQSQASAVTSFSNNAENSLHKTLGQGRLKRKLAWYEFTEINRKKPGVLAYFSFSEEGDWQRQLRDQGPAGRHGTIIRCERTIGRWDENNALDFAPTGSRVRCHIPGTHRQLTLACWVKVNALDRRFNSLMLTDGHELGEPHWQILADGRVHFSVKKRPYASKETAKDPNHLKDKMIHHSPPVWTPEQSGQWMHLAITYNSDKKTVTHYRNGKRLLREQIPEEYLVDTIRIGASSIGNWSEPNRDDPAFAVRNLNGSIAEFIVLSTALPDPEIRELYSNGRP